MLSTMELPPADPLPRPAVDGTSGALNSDANTRDLAAAKASVLDDAGEGARTGVKSVSESDASIVSVDSGAKSNTNADRSATVDVRSDSTPVTNMPENSGAAATASAGSGGAAGGSPPGAERSSVPPPPLLAVPDSDTSSESAAVVLDSSGRSELEETAEEVQLRLSGSESPEPTPADEDRLLRDDTEDGSSSPSAERAGSSPAGGAAPVGSVVPPEDAGRTGPAAADDKAGKPTDQSETPPASKPASPSSSGSSVSKPSWPVAASPRSPAATGDDAQGSTDPVDLPDDMFESAAALNAAEEEEDRERREANQRQAALEAADSLDSLGDSMDVDDARPPPPDAGDDVSMDVPDAASPAGEPAPPSDPENSAASSAAGAEADEDTLDAAEDLLAANGDQPAELGESAGFEGAADLPDDRAGLATDDNSVDPDDAVADPDAAAAVSRKRRCSPSTEADASKVRRLESGRPFIAVKKVQLSENNLRLLQETEERDRRRLEETAAGSSAAAGAAVNGVKSSLLRRVKLLNRQELETLVLEKMCEAIASRSVIGDMKKSAEKHVTAAERFQKKITYLQKQVGDLHLVVRKLSAELKTRRSPSYPVKITRTVGLQVALPKSVPPLTSRPKTAGTPTGTPASTPTGTPGDTPTGTPASNGVLRAHLSSPTRPRQQFGRSPVPQGQILRNAQIPAANIGGRRGRPPGGTGSAAPAGAAVALLPVVRTTLPLGSVPLAGLTSPRRVASPATPGSPGSTLRTTALGQRQASYSSVRGRPRVGRPPRQSPAAPAPGGGGGGGGAADVVDLTDDDDPKRPAAARGAAAALSPRRPAGATSATPVSRPGGTVGLARLTHPAPFPVTPPNPAVHTGQLLPPPPVLKVTRRSNGIVLSWNMDLTSRHASVVCYHLFAYQESGPVTLRANPWKKVGDVRALPLPMACTLTQFQEGHKYHFAVRAEDGFRRRGPFSNPSSIALMGAS